MSLEARIVALAQAIDVDIKALFSGKVNTSAAQTSQVDRTANALLEVGAFGLGKFLDLRPLGITGSTPPSTFFSAGTMTGFFNGGNTPGEAGLAIPALGAVVAYGVLTVHGHWSDSTGGGGVQQIFTTGDRIFTRLPTSATAWAAWREQSFTDNAVFTGATTTFRTEVVRHDPATGISAGYEIGSTAGASTPYLDFHSAATPADYDFRLLFSGGNGTLGQGSAQFLGADVTFRCKSAFSFSLQVPQYTLSTLPSASVYNGYEIDVSNAAGGAKRCRSNGTVWQILNTTTQVS